MRVALILNDDPREKSGFAILSDQVELHAAPPKHTRVDVEGANDRARSLGGIAEHRRGDQAVVRWQHPLRERGIGDLEGEEHRVRFDDETHVGVGARPSVDDVPLESERQLAEHGAALGRGRDLGGHDHLLGGLDVASKVLGLHVFSSPYDCADRVRHFRAGISTRVSPRVTIENVFTVKFYPPPEN